MERSIFEKNEKKGFGTTCQMSVLYQSFQTFRTGSARSGLGVTPSLSSSTAVASRQQKATLG